MISRLMRFLTTLVYPYTNPVERRQARDLLRFASFFFLLTVVVVWVPVALGQLNGQEPNVLIALAITPLFIGLIVVLVQVGRLTIASYLLVTLIALATLTNIIDGINDFSVLAILAPIVAAGVLLDRRGTFAVMLLVMMVLFIGIFARPNITITVAPNDRLFTFFLNGATISFVAVLLLIFGNNAQRLANVFSNDLDDLRRVNNAPELNDLALTETQILTRSLETLRKDFDYSLTRLVLLDDARRIAQGFYSGFGLNELQSGDRFEITVANAMGECLRTNRVIVISNESSDMRQRYLSVGMMAAVLVPLEYQGNVMGAMDLQVNHDKSVTSAHLEALGIYALRLASALVRARNLKQMSEDVREQETIILRQRQRLHELEQVDRLTMPSNTWDAYFQQHANGLVGFDFDMKNAKMLEAKELSPALRDSLEQGELVIIDEGAQQVASVPIFLRDQLLGAMSFRLPKNARLNERQRELLNSVVGRLALALENKRLFEQSQAQATRESKANQVASLLLSSTDINTVLQLAAQSFNEAIGAINTQIHLQQLVETGDKR